MSPARVRAHTCNLGLYDDLQCPPELILLRCVIFTNKVPALFSCPVHRMVCCDVPVSLPLVQLQKLLSSCVACTGVGVCLSAHFKPLWCKNVPHFGIAHALALGLAPWLAAEIPHLVDAGQIEGDKKGGTQGAQ